MSGDSYFDKISDRWEEDVQGSTSATASHAGVAGKRHMVAVISGSSDAASLVSVESPAGTVIWRGRVTAGGSYAITFPPGCLIGASGDLVRVVTATGTSACEANIAGFTIRG